MKKVYKLNDLDCANCAAKMETAINKLDCITSARVNFITQKLTLETEEALESVLPLVQKEIKKVEPDCSIVF